MIADDALELVKARLGISTKVRDMYIMKIIEGVVSEMEKEKGLTIDSTNTHQLMFVVDFASWRYENRGESGSMPRHLQFRLHNLQMSSVGNV